MAELYPAHYLAADTRLTQVMPSPEEADIIARTGTQFVTPDFGLYT